LRTAMLDLELDLSVQAAEGGASAVRSDLVVDQLVFAVILNASGFPMGCRAGSASCQALREIPS